MAKRCERCQGTGWIAPYSYVCLCRAGDRVWAKWQGMTLEEYDRLSGHRGEHGA